MSFWSLVLLEFYKTLRRGRTYIGPVGVIAIVLPVAIGLKYGPMDREIQRFISHGAFTMYGSPINALFVARVVLPPTVFLFLPLFVCLVAGDQLSGEAAEGTLRGILSRPISRAKLLGAKYIVSLCYAVGLTVFLGLSAYTIGYLFFGTGGLVSPWGGIRYFGMQEGIHRLILAYALAAAYQCAVMSIAFLLSVYMSSSLAPVGGTMALMLVLGAFGSIPFFEPLKPYLFTTYAETFLQAFEVPLDWGLLHGAYINLSMYALVTFAGAVLSFNRKDILC